MASHLYAQSNLLRGMPSHILRQKPNSRLQILRRRVSLWRIVEGRRNKYRWVHVMRPSAITVVVVVVVVVVFVVFSTPK